jgi:hypothetical protein
VDACYPVMMNYGTTAEMVVVVSES